MRRRDLEQRGVIELEERLEDVIDLIVQRDRRYQRAAYMFVLEAIDRRLAELDEVRHLSGREVLEAAKELAIERFGMAAKMVFSEWGVRETADIGRIVFKMVDAGILKKTSSDSMKDFTDVFDWEEEFDKRFSWG